MNNAKSKVRRHWYKTWVGECPVCGRDATYRVRVYGKRPKAHALRYVQQPEAETYCGCMR